MNAIRGCEKRGFAPEEAKKRLILLMGNRL
jgi:hypothetical protein